MTDLNAAPTRQPDLTQDRCEQWLRNGDAKVLLHVDHGHYVNRGVHDHAQRVVHTVGYHTPLTPAVREALLQKQLQGSVGDWRDAVAAAVPPTHELDAHHWMYRDGRGHATLEVNSEGYLTSASFTGLGKVTFSLLAGC